MLYRDGVAPREIAKTLNREGVPGPAGKTWGPSTINGNAQRGTGLLNKRTLPRPSGLEPPAPCQGPTSGKSRSKLNSKDHWVIKDVPYLRIVPQELWEGVKARQRAMTRNTRPDHKRQDFWKHQRPKIFALRHY
jgi:hypothetical protein